MSKTNQESPCSAANYIGNRSIRSLDLVGPDHKTLRQKYLIGEPRDCPMGAAEEMKQRGFVGIYLKEPANFFRLPKTGFIVQKTW